jgi:hypothetical protein
MAASYSGGGGHGYDAGMRLHRTVALLALAGLARAAAAQEDPKYLLKHKQTKAPAPTDEKCPPPEAKPVEPPGPWELKLRAGSLFQFNSSKGVVGQRDGSSKSLGFDLHAEANWTGGKNEVRNRLDLAAVFIKTPNLTSWVTASNFLEVESIYQYRARPWAGPFVRAAVNTSILVGRDLRTNTVQYQCPDGTLSGPRTDLRLTDPLRPTTFLQTIGAFVNPIREEMFDLDFRAGFGARETIADDQLGVQDDSMTPAIVELVELHDSLQAGLELIVMVRGEVWEKRIQYYAGGEFLLPALRTKQEGDDRPAFEMIDKRLRVGVAFRIASWATVLYEFRVVHQPQLVDDYQIQNNFGFKATYSAK